MALQRAGVIGWTVRQSYFQRRAGLITLTAITAAGEGAYHVHDADLGEALTFAEQAVPGLLTPFLEPPGRIRSSRQIVMPRSGNRRSAPGSQRGETGSLPKAPAPRDTP